MDEIIGLLSGVKNRFYFYMEPSCPDFTSNKPVKIILCTPEFNTELSIAGDTDSLKKVLSHFSVILADEANVIFSWNLQRFLSYALGKTGSLPEISGQVYDLAVLTSYTAICGQPVTKPKNYVEALELFKIIYKLNNFSNVINIYKRFHRPLIDTLPTIENVGLVDLAKKRIVHACYQIEDSANGRLTCESNYQNSYNPHTLSQSDKENLSSSSYDSYFMYFDYKNMEISVLEWLSKDPLLSAILETGEDLYSAFWEKISGSVAGERQRTLCKNVLLRTIFGIGPDALSPIVNLEPKICKKLIDLIKSKISVAFGFLDSQHSFAHQNGYCQDFFYRKRYFKPEEAYKARNFAIQSPAALVCLYKLIQLNNAVKGYAKVAMSQHDAYYLLMEKQNIDKVYDISKEVLEREEDFFPGIKLKVSCSLGKNISFMKGYGGVYGRTGHLQSLAGNG